MMTTFVNKYNFAKYVKAANLKPLRMAAAQEF